LGCWISSEEESTFSHSKSFSDDETYSYEQVKLVKDIQRGHNRDSENDYILTNRKVTYLMSDSEVYEKKEKNQFKKKSSEIIQSGEIRDN
jgi:hypothetical protein